jgi:hypothetical protein
MASGRATINELPQPLVAALGSILVINPDHAGQRLAQERVVEAIQEALVDRLVTMVVTLAIFATAAGFSILLILAYDRPFAAGGIQVSPAPLREVLSE